MPKNARLTFRVNADLKHEIEAIALKEGRSVAQICEVFLSKGCDRYQVEGAKLLQSYFSRESRQKK